MADSGQRLTIPSKPTAVADRPKESQKPGNAYAKQQARTLRRLLESRDPATLPGTDKLVR